MGWGDIKLPKWVDPGGLGTTKGRDLGRRILGDKNGGEFNKWVDPLGVSKDLRNASVFHSLFNNGAKGPAAPSAGEDPNVTALRGKLFGEAVDFDNSLGGLKEQAGNQIQNEGNLALESGLKHNNQDFNRRGLLYSGLREAGETGVKGRVASTMANQRSQSNQDLGKMATAKYTKAAQVGLQGYQDAVNREAEIEGINLQNQVARAQAMQQLGNTAGYAAGAYYGSRGTPSSPSTGGYSTSTTPYGNQPRIDQGNY